MSRVRVHFLPQSVRVDDLGGSCAVVIDVLRASTTIIHALAAGATNVMACSSIEQARHHAAELPAGQAVLGGERGGLPIEGFDLGNSPAEYRRDTVADKTLVLTTTNGTRALVHCRGAQEVLVGAFVNLSAVTAMLSACERADLICAGTDGQISRDDVLFAGAVVALLSVGGSRRLNDEAILARDAWIATAGIDSDRTFKTRLIAALRDSLGGRNLVHLNMDSDIEMAAEIDRFAVVPCVDRQAVFEHDKAVMIRPSVVV